MENQNNTAVTPGERTIVAFIHQTLTESWDEYQSAPIDKFPARSYELLFAAVKDIARCLETGLL